MARLVRTRCTSPSSSCKDRADSLQPLQVPSDIQTLFSLPPLATSPHHNATFHALLETLSEYTKDPSGPGTLPISATLPDMKADTKSYVQLQNLYRDAAEAEKVRLHVFPRTRALNTPRRTSSRSSSRPSTPRSPRARTRRRWTRS